MQREGRAPAGTPWEDPAPAGTPWKDPAPAGTIREGRTSVRPIARRAINH
ncbi:MAG: hypothetical protein IKP58_09845 [Victivallales bacterium]|nr:hypothetical protein [Victivallales bacterium]